MYKKINNFSLVLITVALLFLCIEVFLRLNPGIYCEGYRPSDNDKIVYELQPNFRIKSLNARISSQGLNDRYFPVVKPAGVYRIAILGDSTSFGWKIGPEHSFPKMLEKLLNDRLHGKYEVINFSVPGYNTSQELAVLKEKVVKFQPDMVVLVYCGNDIHICNYIKPNVTFANFLYHRSYFVHFVLRRLDRLISSSSKETMTKKMWLLFKKNILGMFYYDQVIYSHPGLEETSYINGNPPRQDKDVPYRYRHMLGFENYKNHLANFHEFLKIRDIAFVSSGFFGSDEVRIHGELGIEEICNFEKAFLKEGFSYKQFLLPDGGHMTEEGHLKCAGYLYETLTNGKHSLK